MPDLTAVEQAIRDALASQRWEFPAGSGYLSTPHGEHHYEGWCAVCRSDLDAIARVAAAAARPVIAAAALRDAAAAVDWGDDVSEDHIAGAASACVQLRERAAQITRDACTGEDQT
jgi:hypothetical protein